LARTSILDVMLPQLSGFFAAQPKPFSPRELVARTRAR
jgi:DNA-binding response OmpR family regulator